MTSSTVGAGSRTGHGTSGSAPEVLAVPREAVDRLPWEPLAGSPSVTTKVICTADEDVAGLLRLAPGAQEARHLHGSGEHHVWVLSGTVLVEGDPLPAGSYLHVPRGVLHDLRDAGAGSTLFYVFHSTSAAAPR